MHLYPIAGDTNACNVKYIIVFCYKKHYLQSLMLERVDHIFSDVERSRK